MLPKPPHGLSHGGGPGVRHGWGEPTLLDCPVARVVLPDSAGSNVPRAHQKHWEGSQGAQSACLPWGPAWEGGVRRCSPVSFGGPRGRTTNPAPPERKRAAAGGGGYKRGIGCTGGC